MLLASVQASACLIEYAWTSGASSLYLQGSVSAAIAPPVPYSPPEDKNELISLTVADSSGGLIAAKLDLYKAIFDAYDQQQSQQYFQQLSDVLKQQADMQMSIVKNIASSSLADSLAAAASDGGYLLTLSSAMPGFTAITVPLSCLGPCDTLIESHWAFDRYVPEPSSAALLVVALAALPLGAVTQARRRLDLRPCGPSVTAT